MPIATTCCSSRWRYTTQLGGKCWGISWYGRISHYLQGFLQRGAGFLPSTVWSTQLLISIRSKFSLDASNIWHSWFPLFLENLHPKLSLELLVELFSPFVQTFFLLPGARALMIHVVPTSVLKNQSDWGYDRRTWTLWMGQSHWPHC